MTDQSFASYRSRVFKKGIRRGLELAAQYLETTGADFGQMARRSLADGNKQEFIRLSDKADLLNGQATRVRNLQFKDLRVENEISDIETPPAKGA